MIYVTRTLTDTAMAEVKALGVPVVAGEEEPPDRETLLRQAKGAHAVVCTLTERIDAEFMDAAGPQLKVVANVAVGYDNLDVEAATLRGIQVTNTPGVLDGATADLTMALILAASRRVLEGDRLLRERRPWVWGPRMLVGLDLSAGTTLGVVGYGRIGKAVARRARAFDMRILATPPTKPNTTPPAKPNTTPPAEPNVERVELGELLERSDVVTLHCPLTPATRHLIDGDALRRMKPTAILVNTARGGIVDESALIQALRDGTIAAAALDVFEGEPRVNPDLVELDNLVMTPHLGSAGTATRERMCGLAVANAAAVLKGEPPLTPVNLVE